MGWDIGSNSLARYNEDRVHRRIRDHKPLSTLPSQGVPTDLLIRRCRETSVRRQPKPFRAMPPLTGEALWCGPIDHRERQGIQPAEEEGRQLLTGIVAIRRMGQQ